MPILPPYDETAHPDVVQPLVQIPLTGQGKNAPCRWCGGTMAYLTERKHFKTKIKVYNHALDRMVEIGSHAGGMRCRDCERHLGWLTEDEVAKLRPGQ